MMKKNHWSVPGFTCLAMLALSACKGENKPVDVSSSSTEADKAATDKTGYPGLPTEKEQVSYTIGMAMGKQLSEIKDEVNVDTVVKALRTQMDGGKALVTWKGGFYRGYPNNNPPADQNDEAAIKAVTGGYQAGLDALAERFGKAE